MTHKAHLSHKERLRVIIPTTKKVRRARRSELEKSVWTCNTNTWQLRRQAKGLFIRSLAEDHIHENKHIAFLCGVGCTIRGQFRQKTQNVDHSNVSDREAT